MGPFIFLSGIGIVFGGVWVWFNWDVPAGGSGFAAVFLVLVGLVFISDSFTRYSWPR
jgi:hypothetical protein